MKLQIKKKIHVKKKRIWLSQTQGYIGKGKRKPKKSKLVITLALFFIFFLFHYSLSSFFSGRLAGEWLLEGGRVTVSGGQVVHHFLHLLEGVGRIDTVHNTASSTTSFLALFLRN
jgi:hypothetical protein